MGEGCGGGGKARLKKSVLKLVLYFRGPKKKRDRFSFMYYYLYPWSPPRSGRLRLRISAKVRKSEFVLFFVEGHQLLKLRQTNSMTEIRFQLRKSNRFHFLQKPAKNLLSRTVRKTSCGIYTKRL